MSFKKMAEIILSAFLVMSLLVNCAKNTPTMPTENIETGNHVRINMKVGPVGGAKKSTRANTTLIVEMKKDSITTNTDTSFIGSGSTGIFYDYELNRVNNWYASGSVYDENDSITHRSIPQLVDVGLGEQTLSIPAIVANLQVGFYSTEETKKAFLYIDNILVDTFDITSAGNTVALGFSRLPASPDGISHDISVRVRGDIFGFIDTLLYGGDTTIITKSGETFQTPLNLWYMGPEGPAIVPLRLRVQIGIIGSLTLNGVLESPTMTYEPADYLFVASSGITKVMEFKITTNDNFRKKLEDIDMESENNNMSSYCRKVYLVSETGDTAIANIPPIGGVIGFRDADLLFNSGEVFQLLFDFIEGANYSTRIRCTSVVGETLKGFRVKGTFSNSQQTAEWSNIISFGG